MAEDRVYEFAGKLNGISYREWKKLKIIVDKCFDMKKSEMEVELQLTSIDELEMLIRSQFG